MGGAFRALGIALVLLAAGAGGDVVSEIAAEAKCIHVDTLLDQYGPDGLPAAEGLLREALAIDPHSRAREMLRALVAIVREHGGSVSPATEALLASPAVPRGPPIFEHVQQPEHREPPTLAPPPPPPRQQPPRARAPDVTDPSALSSSVPIGDAAHTRAIALIKQAVELQTRDSDSYSNTPHVIALYREALALLPPDAEAHGGDVIGSVLDNLGIALRAIDRVDEAIVEQRRAVAANPNEPRHRMNLAGTLYMRGDSDGAAEQCRAALALNPMHAKALNILNSVQPITDASDERLTLLMRHAAATDELSAEERTLTHFDLFRALDKLKRYDEAWLHLEWGNALALEDMAARGPVPGDHELRDVYRRIAAAFDARALAALVDGAAAAARAADGAAAAAARALDKGGPIFIVGAYRSGSTLIEQILASHSNVHGAGENTALPPVLGAFQAQLARAHGVVFPEGFVALATARNEPVLFERIGAEYVRKTRASAQVSRSHKPRWTDKNLGNVRNVGVIVAGMPTARIVHTVRSAAATCFSMLSQHFTQGGASGRFFTCSQTSLVAHYAATDELMRHWDRSVPAGRMLTVH